jgi:AraC family transcriptional regulator
MEPTITILQEKKLIGKRATMSLSDDTTGELWRSFMPRRKEILDSIGTALYSMQVFAPSYFDHFDPTAEFVKWATMEVTDFEAVPDEMETYLLPGGLYAVFQHKGANTDTSIFQYIFTTWLPNSDYSLDDRPHFEVLGDKYKNNDPDSEEEIWIPIRLKS